MSYFHKSEPCISPAINPPAACRNQSLAGRAEPGDKEAVQGHPALLDALKTLEKELHEQCHGVLCMERGQQWAVKDLGQEQPVLQTGIEEGKRWRWSQVLVWCHPWLRNPLLGGEGQ